MLDALSIILLVVCLAVIAMLVFLLFKKRGEKEESLGVLTERLNHLVSQNEELRKTMDSKLSETHKATQDQFSKSTGVMQDVTRQANKLMADIHSQSQKVISEVSSKLTKLDETNKQVVNFSSQLQNLQDILKNPKQRGVLGEFYLEEILKNVLPPKSYAMQYRLGKNKEGQELIVDAVVFVKEKIIPVDSKFSLENYEKILNCKDNEERERLEKVLKQDLKTRIDETSKYIHPDKGTFEFAFMFIPSEAIYYDLLVNKVGAVKVNTTDLIEYAFREKSVIIVSPTSFLAYLQTVLQGLRAMQIEESAQDIRKNVEKLRRHVSSYDDFLKKLGGSLSTSVNHYNNAYKEFKKVDKDVARITEQESKVEPEKIEKPKAD